jgi:uncharacterized protein YbjQ (UPF0145 family)
MDPAMVTTTLEFSGYRIQRYLGVVRGLTVRSRSAVGNIAGSLQSLFGGNLSIYTELCEHARQEAFDLMLQHADALGANAIIGMRYDANDVMEGITEVLAYGTAVVLSPPGSPLVSEGNAKRLTNETLPVDVSPAEESPGVGSPTAAGPLSAALGQSSQYGGGQWGEGSAYRLMDALTRVFEAPDPSSRVLSQLYSGAVVLVAATNGDFFQVVTPDDDYGFIARTTGLQPISGGES